MKIIGYDTVLYEFLKGQNDKFTGKITRTFSDLTEFEKKFNN